ncbi:MAG: hypothetical protein R6V53_01435 [Candidatus Woesearchaeota archaeon]
MRLIHIIGLCILVASVMAEVTIDQPPNNQLYTVAEDSVFNLTVIASDTDDYPISFTDTSYDENVSFDCFKKYPVNDTATFINFTPTNEFVGFYSFELNARNTENEVDTIVISFNVTNTNDIPVIDSTSNLTTVHENDTLPVFVSIIDDDLIHGKESINISWTLDNQTSTKLQPVFENDTYSEIMYVPSMFDAGNHTIKVIAKDLNGSQANFTWNITVINVNRPPVLNNTIPNVTWEEDINLTGYLDLMDYFSDPDLNESGCDPNIQECITFNYSIVDGGNISVVINGSNVSFYPDRDFTGDMTIIFNASDGIDHALSNEILLNVTNINDPPVITPVPDQLNYTYVDFHYQVQAYDVDNETLFYSVDSSLSNISIKDGLIEAFPVAGEEGNHTVNVTVSDGINSTHASFTLQVLSNSPPEIINIRNYSVAQHDTLEITLLGQDSDGDELSFTSDSSLDITSINSTSCNVTWTPHDQSLVGNHTIIFTVTDEKGAKSSYKSTIQVNDTPMAPIVYPVSVGPIRTGKQFNLTVYSFDEDGDFERFSDNTSLFDISTQGQGSTEDNATGKIMFTPSSTGYHRILITGNDSLGNKDNTTLILNITTNHAPYFTSINDIITQESIEYSQRINAEDQDWQDDLSFGSNTSLFNITNRWINFTPENQGNHTVRVWVSDGTANVSEIIQVNITKRDDPPFFMPPVETLEAWDQLKEGNTTYFNITAIDEEGDNVTIDLTFINFTNKVGTSNHTLFSFINTTSIANVTTAYVNITPGPLDVGEYWVNISASDGKKRNDRIFPFTVKNINNKPRINWTILYNGTTFSSNATSVSFDCKETMPINFTSLVFDPDYDPLRYNWTVFYPNGSVFLNSNDTEINFTIPYYAHPSFMVTYRVSDNETYSQVNFTLDAVNVNRNITFGTLAYEFDGSGNFDNTYIDDGLKVQDLDRNASFRSQKIDLKTDNANIMRVMHKNLTFEYNESPSYNVSLFFGSVQTSDSIVEYLPVHENGTVQSDNRRFISFMINISGDGTQAPVIDKGLFNYEIHDLDVMKGTEYPGWLDLRNFFHDPDVDDNITYNVTIHQGAGLADLQIIDKHFVQASFLEEGTVIAQVSASDGTSNISSNNIHISIDSKEEVSRSSGSSSTVEYKTQTRNTRRPVALDIIHPENITLYENETAKVPIRLQNNDDFTLNDLRINVSSTRGIGLHLDKDHIRTLEKDDFQTVMLTINMSKIYGTYDVHINVTVDDPSYTDSTKLLISSLKKAQEGEDTSKLKLAFVSDLLKKNEECSELSEYIERARLAFESGDDMKGNELLEQFTNDCKALIQKPKVENPQSTSLLDDRNYRIIAGAVGLIILFTIIISIVTLYRRI